MKQLFQQLINFDANILTIFLLGLIYTLEQFINRPLQLKRTGWHFINGIPLQVGYLGVNYAVAFIFVGIVNRVQAQHIGLFQQFSLPLLFKVIAGLFCIDFVFYWTHRLSHTWAIAWRLHRVHHSDTNLAGASFLRFHPLDALLDNISALVAVVIFGLEMDVVLFFFFVNLVVNILQHSNFVYPAWTDKILGKLFATPNLHKVHHHQDQFYTDSNYGLIFIIWDRMFGTYKHLPVKMIRLGLEEFDDVSRQHAWYLLKSPFLQIERKTVK